MTKLIAILAVLILSGCSTGLKLADYRLVENQNFYEPEGQSVIVVKWIRLPAERLQRVCSYATDRKLTNTVFLGCAGRDPGGTCVIYTGTDTTHQIFGHELRHCFQGSFHQ